MNLKLTLSEILTLRCALYAVKGVAVADGDQTPYVRFDIKDGEVWWNMVRNYSILDAIYKDFNNARIAVIKSLTDDEKGIDVTNLEMVTKFQAEIAKITGAVQEVVGIYPLTECALNLKVNGAAIGVMPAPLIMSLMNFCEQSAIVTEAGAVPACSPSTPCVCKSG